MRKIYLLLTGMLMTAPAWTQLRNEGTQIVMKGNIYLVLNTATLTNNGTFQQTEGTVKFAGGPSFIQGTVQPAFHVLELAKANTISLKLNTHIDIRNSILFTSGLLDLNTKNIYLDPAALLVNENETRRITGSTGGYVEITVPLVNPVNANPGNLGAVITAPKNFPSIIIRRGHRRFSLNSTGATIYRYFEIRPTGTSFGGSKLRINYLIAELGGLPAACLQIWSSATLSSWVAQGYTTRSPTQKFVERTNIPAAPYYSLGYTTAGQPAPCMAAAAVESAEHNQTGEDVFIRSISPTVGTQDKFYIQTGSLPLRNMQVQLYDASGQLLLNRQLAYQSQWCDLPGLSAGVSYVKIISAEKIWIGKFIRK